MRVFGFVRLRSATPSSLNEAWREGYAAGWGDVSRRSNPFRDHGVWLPPRPWLVTAWDTGYDEGRSGRLSFAVDAVTPDEVDPLLPCPITRSRCCDAPCCV